MAPKAAAMSACQEPWSRRRATPRRAWRSCRRLLAHGLRPHGQDDRDDQFCRPATHAYAVFNGSGAGYATGGTANLTNLTMQTSGAASAGVVTTNSGTTTINGGSIATIGVNAFDVLVTSGATTKVTGTTLTTSADGSTGIEVTDAGSKLTASGISVTTQGSGTLSVPEHGVRLSMAERRASRADRSRHRARVLQEVLTQNAGSSTTITGTTVTTNGNGSSGLTLHGTGSSLTVSDAMITTHGNVDPATGYEADGVDNATNPSGTVVGGGVASLTDT